MKRYLRDEWPGLIAGAVLILLGLALLPGGCTVEVHAQATQPATAAQQLRSTAAYVEQLEADRLAQAAKIAEIEAERAKLAELAVPFLEPGEKPQAGRIYRLRDGAQRIDVDVPDVTLVGGTVHAIPDGAPGNGSAAITARPGGDNLTVFLVRFHYPAADPNVGGKLPLKPCVRTHAKGTRIVRCTTGQVNGFVEALPGADGTVIDNSHAARGLRSAFLYAGGADNTTVVGCTAFDSATENLVRWSPHNGVVGKGAIVAWSRLGNPGNKSIIDFRHVGDAIAIGNELYTDEHGTAIGVGRGGEFGADNVRILKNTLHGGRIHVHQCRGLTVEDNRILWERQGENVAIFINLADDVRVRRNGGPKPLLPHRKYVKRLEAWVDEWKPLVGYTEHTTRIDDDGSSGWIEPRPPATQPATQPTAQ